MCSAVIKQGLMNDLFNKTVFWPLALVVAVHKRRHQQRPRTGQFVLAQVQVFKGTPITKRLRDVTCKTPTRPREKQHMLQHSHTTGQERAASKMLLISIKPILQLLDGPPP